MESHVDFEILRTLHLQHDRIHGSDAFSLLCIRFYSNLLPTPAWDRNLSGVWALLAIYLANYFTVFAGSGWAGRPSGRSCGIPLGFIFD